jgi:hypothetical protein
MTCAGICSTAICRFQLGESEPTKSAMIEQGLGWLSDHFAVAQNPASDTWNLYYLYSLERVGRILDTEFIGEHEWYPAGAKYLVGAQLPDGGWKGAGGEDDPRIATPLALLFLTRATPLLAAKVKHGGNGTLKTMIATPPPARLYIILDASGSMIDPMNGKQKFELARDAVAKLVEGLPKSTQVALRVYGHRKRATEEGANEDTALEIPMGELDHEKFAATLKSLRPRGMTPLALSLDQAAQDLSGTSEQNPVTILLLTDGGDDVRGHPVKSAAALRSMAGVKLHILAFDIHRPDWAAQLHSMAAAADGTYWPAEDKTSLRKEIRSAVLGAPDEFVVSDAQGTEVGRGEFGEIKALPEGQFRINAKYASRAFAADFRINTDATTGVMFDASQVAAAAPPTTPDTTHPNPAPTPTSPNIAPAAVAPSTVPVSSNKFCTRCGHALPVGARFCPNCGAVVGGADR